jgi:hypothetical protein
MSYEDLLKLFREKIRPGYERKILAAAHQWYVPYLALNPK